MWNVKSLNTSIQKAVNKHLKFFVYQFLISLMLLIGWLKHLTVRVQSERESSVIRGSWSGWPTSSGIYTGKQAGTTYSISKFHSLFLSVLERKGWLGLLENPDESTSPPPNKYAHQCYRMDLQRQADQTHTQTQQQQQQHSVTETWLDNVFHLSPVFFGQW